MPPKDLEPFSDFSFTQPMNYLSGGKTRNLNLDMGRQNPKIPNLPLAAPSPSQPQKNMKSVLYECTSDNQADIMEELKNLKCFCEKTLNRANRLLARLKQLLTIQRNYRQMFICTIENKLCLDNIDGHDIPSPSTVSEVSRKDLDKEGPAVRRTVNFKIVPKQNFSNTTDKCKNKKVAQSTQQAAINIRKRQYEEIETPQWKLTDNLNLLSCQQNMTQNSNFPILNQSCGRIPCNTRAKIPSNTRAKIPSNTCAKISSNTCTKIPSNTCAKIPSNTFERLPRDDKENAPTPLKKRKFPLSEEEWELLKMSSST